MRDEKVKRPFDHEAVQRRVGRGWLALVATPERPASFPQAERQRMFAERYATKTSVCNL